MMNSAIQQRFSVDVRFPTIFIDPDAKLPENVDDPFQEENEKLLNLMTSTFSMKMKTLEEQNDELHNIMNSTIFKMQDEINLMGENVSKNSIAISENTDVSDLVRAHGFECIDTIEMKRAGNIRSANFPANYPSRGNASLVEDCFFSLSPLPGMTVQLEWKYLKVISVHSISTGKISTTKNKHGWLAGVSRGPKSNQKKYSFKKKY